MTKTAVELAHLVAEWPDDVRDEVLETFGSLSILCATRGAPEHRAAADFLVVARRLIRIVGEMTDAANSAHDETGAE
ncbi:MAG TPA: hypothetical protein PLZ93_00485 [Nocardioides sp.]|uniref:hypothetical protein n=1 Tax=uncultured Nocardioides sp. TaxID=198441 RepID=UPI002611AC74|nr:hypothetical protein [uncultured Nocardioides sp.]HRD60458.1 hypothetical protein [Nocardioides sp.]HRI94069.1 hypothetical protein [Nocardioides sp.]HRK44124.1 hypothetical protein [Nocardioides sp.]